MFGSTLNSIFDSVFKIKGETQGERDLSAEITIFLLSLPYLWVLWGSQYPIMQDLAGHLEVAHLRAQVEAGVVEYSSLYRVHAQPWPNSLGVLVLSWIGDAVGYLNGAKLILSAYILLWPLSLALLARSLRRSPWLALLALPTVLDMNWAMGLFNYLIAKPFLILSVVAAIYFARRGGWWRGLLLSGLLGVTFLSHALVWIFTMAGAGLAIAMIAKGKQRILRLWPLLPICLIPLHYMSAQVGVEAPGKFVSNNPLLAITRAWPNLGMLNKGLGDDLAYAVSGLILGVLLFVAFKERRTANKLARQTPQDEQDGPSKPDEQRADEQHKRRGGSSKGILAWGSSEDRFLVLSTGIIALIYLFAPLNLPNVDVVSQRQLVFAWSFFLLWPTGPIRGWRRTLIVVGMSAAVLVHSWSTHWHYEQFNEFEMGGFEELLESIPERKRVAVAYSRAKTPYGYHKTLWHWPKLYSIQRGGRTDDSFTYRTTNSVVIGERLQDPPPFKRHRMKFKALQRWDYLLIHDPSQKMREGILLRFEAVGEASHWRLFKIQDSEERPLGAP